jgi:hypothetical protein
LMKFPKATLFFPPTGGFPSPIFIVNLSYPLTIWYIGKDIFSPDDRAVSHDPLPLW